MNYEKAMNKHWHFLMCYLRLDKAENLFMIKYINLQSLGFLSHFDVAEVFKISMMRVPKLDSAMF